MYITELKPDMHGMQVSCVLGKYQTDVKSGIIYFKNSRYSILQNMLTGSGYTNEYIKKKYTGSWNVYSGSKEMLITENVLCLKCIDSRYTKYYDSFEVIDEKSILKNSTETDSNSVTLLTKSKFITINQNE